jgi:predicted 3-demethylubiquinone-9 3-methyltransferase (glyoxalase superfamily)
MSKIAPCLWFDGVAVDAARLYVDVFSPALSAQVASTSPVVVEFDIDGQRFQGLNGGPMFRPNPSISFFVHFDDEATVRRVATMLAAGGQELMPLGAWPWSPCYAWVQDRYGVTWQVMQRASSSSSSPSASSPTVVPSLLFSGAVHARAHEAMEHYVGVFGGGIDSVERYGDADPVPIEAKGTLKHARFTVGGQQFAVGDSHMAHGFSFSEGISLSVRCADQAEVDRVWSALLSGGGSESRCGWLKDRFGVSWQVVPDALVQLQRRGDAQASARMMQAMMTMAKLNVAALQRAYDGG